MLASSAARGPSPRADVTYATVDGKALLLRYVAEKTYGRDSVGSAASGRHVDSLMRASIVTATEYGA